MISRHLGGEERERMERGNSWRDTGWEFSRIDKRWHSEMLRIPKNFKQEFKKEEENKEHTLKHIE